MTRQHIPGQRAQVELRTHDHSLIHSLLTHSLTHCLTHITHSLTYSLTSLFLQLLSMLSLKYACRVIRSFNFRITECRRFKGSSWRRTLCQGLRSTPGEFGLRQAFITLLLIPNGGKRRTPGIGIHNVTSGLCRHSPPRRLQRLCSCTRLRCKWKYSLHEKRCEVQWSCN